MATTTARDVRKNFNLFVDGAGYAGQVESFTPPKLSLKLEEFRAGGMDAPVSLEMGMDKLEASGVLLAFDRYVISQFGLVDGNSTKVVLREALESFGGSVSGAVHTMAGRFNEIDSGESKAGEKTTLKFNFALTYYRLEIGGISVLEIDIPNMIRKVNGVDVLAARRTALGL